MKTLRFILACFIIIGMFGVCIVDSITMERGWKQPVLGFLYGVASIVIFF